MSDSHGRTGNILDAVENEMPDYVFHLGDLGRDVDDVRALDPMLPLCTVSGNCDGWYGDVEEREFELCGIKFFLTHGHRYHVKAGLTELIREGETRGVHVVCFGHTHQPLAEQRSDGMWLLNPGTVGGVYNKATYAVIEIESGEISVVIREVQ